MESQTRNNAYQSSSGTPERPFRRIAVLGAGVMGSQIAAHFANAGLQVDLLDIASPTGPKNAVVEGAFKRLQKLKPSPFVTTRVSRRIRLGNFDEHFERIADVDWIIEVVVENMAIKRQVMERIESTARPDAVVTTNTSGLPIHQISQGRSPEFRRRFMGTHFFNPPRYLYLFELIPTPETDPRLIERVRNFARLHLGKGVVIAKDTPNFIGNRIGVYSMTQAIRAMTDGGYSIEEVDLLTGELIGYPRSATFRTADVVGLDTMIYVTENLYEAVPDDESRECFQIPDLLRRLVDSGALGAKTRKGFYRKVGRDILSVNPDTLEYEAPRPLDLGDVESLKKAGGLAQRLRALFEAPGRAGDFFRQTTLDKLAYSARRIPEISDSPADVDRAVRWGFGWSLGPFQTWDVLGFEKVLTAMGERDIAVPDWVARMRASDHRSFYRSENKGTTVFIPATSDYSPDERFADEIKLDRIKSSPNRIVWENDEAGLLDVGDGVLLYEFRSRGNSLGMNVMAGLAEAVEIVEGGDYLGLVVGNQGRNFSAGANLAEMGTIALEGRFDVIGQAAKQFQDVLLRLRYSSKPVVAALHSQVLGGACELAMNCAQVVAPTETYIGLVELGVGLIPAGTGTTHMAARAAEAAANELPSQVQPFLQRAFETVATATVATSAQMAVEVGYLEPTSRVTMNSERRLHVAKEEVLRLANQGYRPPPYRDSILVLGRPARAAMQVGARSMALGGFATEYDCFLAERLAHIMTGGDLSGPSYVSEDYLHGLEREVILSLLGEKKTQERIEHMLRTKKPLRN